MCSPFEGMPINRSPSRIVEPSNISSFSTAPTANPDKSNSPSANNPGNSDVSPPMSAQPHSMHAAAMPRTIDSTTSASIFPIAI